MSEPDLAAIVQANTDASVQRMFDGHRANLATLNVDDPASLVYKRPDLAAQYRERFEADFRDILNRHGITAPAAPTAEQVREERFEAGWLDSPIPPNQWAMIEEQIVTDNELSPAQRAERVAALKAEFGDEGYAELVQQALAGWQPGQTMPLGVASNKFALLNVAALERGEKGAPIDWSATTTGAEQFPSAYDDSNPIVAGVGRTLSRGLP
jgi:hypothetical protein